MNGHPTREEDFDLLALGALEGEEKKAVESHAAGCAVCAAKLAEARGRVSLLAFAAPTTLPPPGAKQRLMAKVLAEKDAAATEKSRALAKSPGRRIRGSERPPGSVGWWSAILIPASVALAISTFLLWTQNRKLDQQMVTLRSIVQIEHQELEDARQNVDLIEASDTMIVPLAQQPGMAKGAAKVMYNARMGMLAFQGTLDAAPADKSYQLWLVPAQGDPISAGTFNPASGETSHWLMKLTPGIAPKAFAVTIEPAGGVKQPTGAKVLVGAPS